MYVSNANASARHLPRPRLGFYEEIQIIFDTSQAFREKIGNLKDLKNDLTLISDFGNYQ